MYVEEFRCKTTSTNTKKLWTFECKDGHVRPPASKSFCHAHAIYPQCLWDRLVDRDRRI